MSFVIDGLDGCRAVGAQFDVEKMVARLGLGQPPPHLWRGHFARPHTPGAVAEEEESVFVIALVLPQSVRALEVVVIIFEESGCPIPLKVGEPVLSDLDRLARVDGEPVAGALGRSVGRIVVPGEEELLRGPFAECLLQPVCLSPSDRVGMSGIERDERKVAPKVERVERSAPGGVEEAVVVGGIVRDLAVVATFDFVVADSNDHGDEAPILSDTMEHPGLEPIDPARGRDTIGVGKVATEQREVWVEGTSLLVHGIDHLSVVHHVATGDEPDGTGHGRRHRPKPPSIDLPGWLLSNPDLIDRVRRQVLELDPANLQRRGARLTADRLRGAPLRLPLLSVPEGLAARFVEVDPVDCHRGRRVVLPGQVEANQVLGRAAGGHGQNDHAEKQRYSRLTRPSRALNMLIVHRGDSLSSGWLGLCQEISVWRCAPSVVEIGVLIGIFLERMLFQLLEGRESERALVCRGQPDRRGKSSIIGLLPAGGTDAPAVTGFEAGEIVGGHRGDQVIARRHAEFEKLGGNACADGVNARILRPCVTLSIAVKAREGTR